MCPTGIFRSETDGADWGMSPTHPSHPYCLDPGHSHPHPAFQIWGPGAPPLICHFYSVPDCLSGLLLKLLALPSVQSFRLDGYGNAGVGRCVTPSPHLCAAVPVFSERTSQQQVVSLSSEVSSPWVEARRGGGDWVRCCFGFSADNSFTHLLAIIQLSSEACPPPRHSATHGKRRMSSLVLLANFSVQERGPDFIRAAQ